MLNIQCEVHLCFLKRFSEAIGTISCNFYIKYAWEKFKNLFGNIFLGARKTQTVPKHVWKQYCMDKVNILNQAGNVMCKLLPLWSTYHTCIELQTSKFDAPAENCSNSDSISFDAPDINCFKKEAIFTSANDIASSKLEQLRQFAVVDL